jgi:ATP-dependent DNA helicase RecQ
MLVKIFTLRFNTTQDAFDDTPLVEFIKDKVVLSLKEYFFIKNETPYMAILVNYEPVQESSSSAVTKKGDSRRDESWRALLQEADMPLFESLRSWRSEHCKNEGMPPYIVCNNTQLARIAATRPQTKAALMQIEGFGKAKVDKYGAAMLKILKSNTEKPQKLDKQQSSDKEQQDGNNET